jgi:SET domain-containing protein
MLPHYKVYTRLGLSKIHGIGVFAIADIPANTYLFEYDNTVMTWIDANELKDIPVNFKLLYDDFCVYNNEKNMYGCPINFNELTMAWYMNDSDQPNVKIDKEYNFSTKRLIKEGEELTVNYKTFSEKAE